MDRREAVLRELNLYPQWVRRNRHASVVEDAPVHVLAADEMRVPLAADVSTTLAPNPNTSQPPQPLPASPSQGRSGGGAGEQVVFPPDKGGSRGVAGLDWPELKRQVHDCTACKLRAGCTQTVFGVGDDNVYIANIVKCRPPGNRAPAADEIAQCLPYLQRQIELIQPKLIVALGKVASNALLGKDATLASLRGKLHEYQLATATGLDGGERDESSRLPPLPHQTTSSHRVRAAIPLIVTYHPAYLLRSPTEKAKAWQDLCFAIDAMQK